LVVGNNGGVDCVVGATMVVVAVVATATAGHGHLYLSSMKENASTYV
jgi:hypothetical protein